MKHISFLLFENFQFLEVKSFIHLNRCVCNALLSGCSCCNPKTPVLKPAKKMLGDEPGILRMKEKKKREISH